jgi:hypothetical protein
MTHLAPGSELADWRNARVETILANVAAAQASIRPLPECPVCGRPSTGENTLCGTCAKSANALGVYGCAWCGKPVILSAPPAHGITPLCDDCIPF